MCVIPQAQLCHKAAERWRFGCVQNNLGQIGGHSCPKRVGIRMSRRARARMLLVCVVEVPKRADVRDPEARSRPVMPQSGGEMVFRLCSEQLRADDWPCLEKGTLDNANTSTLPWKRRENPDADPDHETCWSDDPCGQARIDLCSAITASHTQPS